jgi:outer membrane immunogenic protein
MKRILIAGAFALAAGGQALAADLPQPMAPPPPRAPSTYVPTTAPGYNWGGVYFGINGGYDLGYSNWSDPNNPGATSSGSFSPSGALVGGTLGGNYQMGQFVLGIEGDVDYSFLKGSVSPTSLYCGVGSCQTSENWLATARGRIGYAFDRILLYGTGGGAFGNIIASDSSPGLTGTQSTSVFGWTAGAGIEAALSQNWTAKIEYLYVSLGNGSCNTAGPCGTYAIGPLAGTTVNDSVSLKENLVRAGINYKFSF